MLLFWPMQISIETLDRLNATATDLDARLTEEERSGALKPDASTLSAELSSARASLETARTDAERIRAAASARSTRRWCWTWSTG